jgi:hypothetical protein
MHHEFNIITLLFVILTALLAGIDAWRWRRIPGLHAFIPASFGIILWALGIWLSARSGTDPQQSQFWLRISILGVDLLPIAWFAFVLLYAQGKQRLSWLTWVLLLTLPVISQLSGISGQILTGFQPAILIESGATMPWMSIRHSIWGWVHLLVGMLILFSGGVLLILHLARTPGIMRKRTRWIESLPWYNGDLPGRDQESSAKRSIYNSLCFPGRTIRLSVEYAAWRVFPGLARSARLVN